MTVFFANAIFLLNVTPEFGNQALIIKPRTANQSLLADTGDMYIYIVVSIYVPDRPQLATSSRLYLRSALPPYRREIFAVC